MSLYHFQELLVTHYGCIVAIRFPLETEIMILPNPTALCITKEPGGTVSAMIQT